jgi:hypothetical protein
MTEEEYPSGGRLVALAMMSGLKLARNASRLDLEKEVFMCFDFRAPVVTRLVRQSPVAYRVGSQCTRLNKGMSRC